MITELPSPESLDDIILEDYPYPIAVAYNHLLETQDPIRQAALYLEVFHFSVRAVAFAAIIGYLQDDVVNSPVLNKRIRQYLKKSPTGYWVEMLDLTLEAYQGQRDRFFIAELYDLRHADPERWGAVLRTMTALSTIRNDLKEGEINAAAIAPELREKLLSLLGAFQFIRNYELWRLRDIDRAQQCIRLEVFRGKDEPVKQDVSIATIRSPHVDELVPGQFYLRNAKNELLRLHPLIISSEAIRHLEDALRWDTAVYQAFRDKEENEEAHRGELIYHLMQAVAPEQRVSGDLVTFFLRLYNELLLEKEQATSTRHPVNARSLREAFQHYNEGEMAPARDKYIPEAYLERPELNEVLRAFMQQRRPAVVISGGVGVGKTNLLVHYFDTELANQPNIITLWLDGSGLNVERGLSRTLLGVLDRYLAFEALPEQDDAANRLLRDILDHYLPDEMLVIVVDAANENNKPMDAFKRVNDFIREFPGIQRVKVILSTRPQVWQYTKDRYLKTNFKASQYFSAISDRLKGALLKVESDSFVMERYRLEELPEAFKLYASYYRLVDPDLKRFTPSLRQVIRDPLQLRLLCEGHDGRKPSPKRIPDDMKAEDIIPSLMDSLVKDPETSFEQADFDFLTQVVVPQFVPEGKPPVAKLTRSRLMGVRIGNRTLDDLVDDRTVYSDRTPVNAQVQRLLDTGWLLRTDTGSGSYELSFRYEYFYDYFVGKYLFEQYEKSVDPEAYFKQLIAYLNAVPFLWGGLRNLLTDLLRKRKYRLIEKLGITKEPLQYELLSSVISEHYPDHCDSLDSIFMNWLTISRENALAPEIAANVAINNGIELVLKAILNHPQLNIRFLVIQHVYQLWLGKRQVLERLFTDLADKIDLRRLGANIEPIDTLLRCSLLLGMTAYSGSSSPDKLESVGFVLRIWRSVMRRLFFVTDLAPLEAVLKRIRRAFLQIVVNKVVEAIEKMIGGQSLFNYPDLEASFPADAHRARTLRRLISHIDAAAGNPPESIQALMDYIEKLARKNDNNYITTCIALAATFAHGLNSLIETFGATDELLRNLETTYQTTLDRKKPTVHLWYAMMGLVLSALPSFGSMDRDTARQLLLVLHERRYTWEERFFTTCVFKSGATFWGNAVVDVVWGYELDLPEVGVELLAHFLNLFIVRNDFEQIKRSIYSLVEGIEFYQLPEAAFAALYDLIQIVKPYLASLEEARKSEFWQYFADETAFYAGNYRDYMVAFVERCGDDLPYRVKARLSEVVPAEDMNRILLIAAAKFFRTAILDEKPFARDLVKWGFSQTMEARSVKDLVLRCVVYLGNLTFGDELFTPVKSITERDAGANEEID